VHVEVNVPFTVLDMVREMLQHVSSEVLAKPCSPPKNLSLCTMLGSPCDKLSMVLRDISGITKQSKLVFRECSWSFYRSLVSMEYSIGHSRLKKPWAIVDINKPKPRAVNH
jgi:hypothetical protein